MSDWDQDSRRLHANLLRALQAALEHAQARRTLALEDLRDWHRIVMAGLEIPQAAELGADTALLVGAFRGPPKLAGIEVRMGSSEGVPSSRVAQECRLFIAQLQAMLAALDALWPIDRLDDLTQDGLFAAAKVAAWSHGEWVRIHPFANGNGRTARLLANSILVRYGLPPVMRTRPRPAGSYVVAATAGARNDYAAMQRFILTQILLKTKAPRRSRR